jgi:hypothetical protein
MRVPILILLGAVLWAGVEDGRAQAKQADTPSNVKRLRELEARVSPVIPTPQESYWGEGNIPFGDANTYRLSVELPGGGSPLLEPELRKRVEKNFDVKPGSDGTALRVIFTTKPLEAPEAGEKVAYKLSTIGREGYVLKTGGEAEGNPYVLVAGNSDDALWRGLATVAQLVSKEGEALVFPQVEIVDYPSLDDRALLVDIGGQGFMVGPSRWSFEQWKEFVDWMVDQKLNVLWLEFIGSGRLMGNLNIDAGEWAGFPLTLKSYPEMVLKDRPIRRWDPEKKVVVQDKYTAPNVEKDFVRDLIDYAQARGVECHLLIGYDYFANQFPVVLGIPHNDPSHPEANRVYDIILKEIVERYSNASGVSLCTIEAKNPPAGILKHIIRRTNEAYKIIRAINPKMKVSLLADYIEWQPNQLEDLRELREGVPSDVALAYSPHGEPQQKSWKRVYGDVWRYKNYTQYAWDHIIHIFPQRILDETLKAYADGYRRLVTQAWYFDVAQLNFQTMAEYSWNLTSAPVSEFWPKALVRTFGEKGAEPMREALAHTRFEPRFDIVSRIILRENILSPFSFWDMYVLTKIERLDDKMLKVLEDDARASLAAAERALPLVKESSRGLVEMTVISAKRRLYLATSARQLLIGLQLQKDGDIPGAREALNKAIVEGEKMLEAATGLGIEYPMAVHDDEVVERYRQVLNGLPK